MELPTIVQALASGDRTLYTSRRYRMGGNKLYQDLNSFPQAGQLKLELAYNGTLPLDSMILCKIEFHRRSFSRLPLAAGLVTSHITETKRKQTQN